MMSLPQAYYTPLIVHLCIQQPVEKERERGDKRKREREREREERGRERERGMERKLK